jgi:hypothetical protein
MRNRLPTTPWGRDLELTSTSAKTSRVGFRARHAGLGYGWGMARSLPSLVAAVLLLGACQDDVWYRAEAVDDGWLIARADPEDQSCTIMFIKESAPESWDEPVSGINVKLEGREDAHVAYVREATVDFDQCTTEDADGEPLTSDASGRVRFKQVTVEPTGAVACVVKLDAEVAGVRFKRKLDVWDVQCPPPDGETHEVDLRDAEFDTYSWDFPILQFVGEVPETGACAYVVFPAGSSLLDPVAPPDGRIYSRAGVYLPEDGQECTHETATDALGLPDQRHVHVQNVEDTGRLSFSASEPYDYQGQEVLKPCRASLDVTVEMSAQYPWVPRKLHFAAEDFAVEPSCSG